MKKRNNRKQLDLFGNGDQAKEVGMDQVRANTDEDYRSAFDNAVIGKPHGFHLTSEIVRDEVGDPPGHPSAVGALMNALARAGYIQPTHTQVKAQRVRSHSAKLEVWVRT